MSIYAYNVQERMGKMRAYRKEGEESWKWRGVMEYGMESSHFDSSSRERSVIYDENMKRRKKTNKKPRLYYQSDDYSWRTEKEVEIAFGDYVFVGGIYDDVEYVRILRVIELVEETKNKAEVIFEDIGSWNSRRDSECSFEGLVARINPKLVKGVKKAMKLDSRERFWWSANKYKCFESL